MTEEQPTTEPGSPPPLTPPTSPTVVEARPIGYAAQPLQPPPRPPSPLNLLGIQRSDAGLDLALVALVLLIVPIGGELATALLLPGLTEAPEGLAPSALYTMLISRKWFDALLAVGVAGYLVRRHQLRAASFGLQSDHLGRQILWSIPTLVAVYAVFFISVLVISAIVLTTPGAEQDMEERSQFLEMLPVNDFIASILLLIPVAIHEELLFRGLLIPYLRRLGCRWGVAIAISSVIFAVLHFPQGWFGVVQILGVGFVLGSFFVTSRSLLTVIIAHFCFDLIQLQLARFVLPWIQKLADQAATSMPS